MSSFNQLTMVQLTIDNAKMQIPIPKSHITNRQARPLVQMFAMFPMFPLFAMFSRTRGAWKKKTEQQGMWNVEFGMRNADAEARASARAYHPKRHSQSGIWNSNSRLKPGLRTFYHPVRRSGVHPSLSRRGAFGIWNPDPQKPGLKTSDRFTRFKCFRHFISFTRFKRFRNIWPRRKMKQIGGKQQGVPGRAVEICFFKAPGSVAKFSRTDLRSERRSETSYKYASGL